MSNTLDEILWQAMSQSVTASINSDEADTSKRTAELFHKAKAELLAHLESKAVTYNSKLDTAEIKFEEAVPVSVLREQLGGEDE